ncbi:hypothetical protein HF864_09215 [Lactobacillus sp. MRS-253-APC-2B]|uniref:hypothetical protein n=1 Tax=Lactobacillus sp. MRS-253-APC-2B TaxID=2725305 RepID=UPI00146D00AE|nr:hypothetical protein [Lactobacillus sp. MRS-253-APC-2B]NME34928.1 hypothetical protein [Lactobacillus sp. MRS-253-APC-2B]
MDMMSEQDVQAVVMTLRECNTLIPVELERDVAIVDLSTLDLDALGRGLSNASKPRLLRAYRPDYKSITWWQNGSQTTRKLKTKTTDRVSAFDKQLNVYSPTGKPYTLSQKGRGNRRYLGFGIRVFGFTRTAYIQNLIMAETMARVHPSAWNRVKSAWDVDYLTWTGYTVHHILPYETSTIAGNTPLNLILLDDWTHDTTKVQYNQLRRRILDGDIKNNKMLILPKNGAMQALQNIPSLGLLGGAS